MSTASIKRLPRAVREQQMLDAAVQVFARRGFHAASMDEIAEVAGISKPMVYAYLGTKDELFLACLRREATLLLEAVASGVEPAARPDQQLWNGLRAFFGFVGDHRDGWRVLYRQARSEPIRRRTGRDAGRIIEVVTGLLEGAATAAEVPGRARRLHGDGVRLVGAAESLADWFVDWGGASFNPTLGYLFVNSSDLWASCRVTPIRPTPPPAHRRSAGDSAAAPAILNSRSSKRGRRRRRRAAAAGAASAGGRGGAAAATFPTATSPAAAASKTRRNQHDVPAAAVGNLAARRQHRRVRLARAARRHRQAAGGPAEDRTPGQRGH